MPSDGSFYPDRESLMLRLAAAVMTAGRSSWGPALIILRVRLRGDADSRLDSAVEDEAREIQLDRLREILKRRESLGRTGVDEFAILVEASDSAFEVENRLMRILAALDSTIQTHSETIRAQCFAGIACFPEGGREPDLLMRNAEAALSIAEEQNAPYRFWVDGLGESTKDRKRFEDDLAEAIEHDQLELHFQPLVDAITGEVEGMEALARWRRSGYGWVPPLEFFPAAQACGLLETLEEWVLRRAASTHANWRRRGISRGRLSINCVPSFLARPTFVPRVLSILDVQGLSGEAVEFEVGEDSFRPGSQIPVESLKSLRESGMRVAIDDFAWAHLTKQQLVELPVDRLKIAPECLPNASARMDQPGDGASALSIIRVAKELGLDLSAEGVETKAQRDFLLEKDCRIMQGFFLARPMTPLDAAVLLRRGQIDG